MKKLSVLILSLVLSLSAVQVFAQAKSGAEVLEAPKRRYRIAFSNGDMNNSWRWAFVQSMQEWAGKYQNLGPGIDFIWTNSHADSARQLMDCETLLAMKPDMLILSPNQDEPLDPVIDMATKAKVPLMVIDRSLVRQPGVGTYFVNITQNFAFTGMYQAMYALEFLKAKYGSYKGKIVEIQGLIGASPSTDEYVGLRAVLKNYPDIKIIATGDGSYSQEGGRTVMEGFLQKYPKKDDFDLIICYSDSEALGAIEAIKAAKRTDLLDGRIMGKDQMVEYLELLQNGQVLMTTECSPYYGPFAMKMAIEYLNGTAKPQPITYLPLRCWENPKGKVDLTPAKNDAEIIKNHIAFAKARNLVLVPPESGNYPELTLDLTKTKGYDIVMEYSKTRKMPAGIYDLQNTK
jgi:ABC-type sugar transport system substrate-binding protein